MELDYKQCNLKNSVSFDYRNFLQIMGIFFQKEMESTAFHPEAFIILTALYGSLTGKGAGKPMASKMTTGPTSRFFRVRTSVQSSADIGSHRCDRRGLVLKTNA